MNQLLYERLCDVARQEDIARYSEVAPIVGLDMANPEDRVCISKLLDDISRHEHRLGHPLLSAVVIHKEDNMPGNGFFVLAQELKLFRGGDRFGYFLQELRRVHEHWRVSQSRRTNTD
jgi:hypothetical protein